MISPDPRRPVTGPRALRGATALVVLALLAGCTGRSYVARRYDRSRLEETLSRLETPGLVLGEFSLPPNAVVDGDTIKVAGLDTSLRLLAIDTEETFKHDEDRRLYAAGWQHYLEAKGALSGKPKKLATPLGEEAKRFAQRFFAGVRRVRLERDHPKDVRGRYNRYLAYVFAMKDGQWVNYNVECVRAGMSPYFTKYGYSRRFHDQFVQAQREAREAGRGIWDPTLEHDPDYEIRLKWWNARADFIQAFEAEGRGRDDYISLTHWDALRQIEDHVGREVELLATVSDIRLGDRGPTKVLLSRRMMNDFPLIFFDKDVFGSSGLARCKGEFVRVRGIPTRYFNKYRKKYELQIVVTLPRQILGSFDPTTFWAQERKAAFP